MYHRKTRPRQLQLKEKILESCMIWMQACTDKTQREAWKIVFPLLAQFQTGVRCEPLGINYSNLAQTTPDATEMARMIMEKSVPNDLRIAVDQEESRLRQLAEDLVGGRE